MTRRDAEKSVYSFTHLLSVISYLPSAFRYLSSTIYNLLSFICYLSSTIYNLLSLICYLLSIIYHLSSVICYLLSVICYSVSLLFNNLSQIASTSAWYSFMGTSSFHLKRWPNLPCIFKNSVIGFFSFGFTLIRYFRSWYS